MIPHRSLPPGKRLPGRGSDAYAFASASRSLMVLISELLSPTKFGPERMY